MGIRWNRTYRTAELNVDGIPHRKHVYACRKRLRVAMFLSGICMIFSVVKMIVAHKTTVDNQFSIVLGVGFYVNLVLAAYFYVLGMRNSRCCRCGRHVPVRRYNIGRILLGEFPLCPECKLMVGADFVMEYGEALHGRCGMESKRADTQKALV